jgi:hypothetical protein
MPEDTSPHGGEAFHPPPQRARIPDPPPQATDPVAHGRTDTVQRPDEDTIARRPSLPEGTQTLAADVEDEDADPVVEAGPGVADPAGQGTVSVTRQPGG